MTYYPSALQELIEEFQEVDDKRERLEMVYELAEEIVLLPVDEWNAVSYTHLRAHET